MRQSDAEPGIGGIDAMPPERRNIEDVSGLECRFEFRQRSIRGKEARPVIHVMKVRPDRPGIRVPVCLGQLEHRYAFRAENLRRQRLIRRMVMPFGRGIPIDEKSVARIRQYRWMSELRPVRPWHLLSHWYAFRE